MHLNQAFTLIYMTLFENETALRQAGENKLKDNLQLLHKHCHDVKTKTDLITIKRYKFRQDWDKVYKKFPSQFEKLNWVWDNDLPSLV